LLRQIELVRPFSILAVGRAAQSLLGSEEPLANLRQVTHGLMVAGQKIPLIATHHPFHLLSHPADKAAAWQDLQLLKTVSGL
jgi:DNA polymerase